MASERGAGASLALAVATVALLLAMLVVGAGTAAIAQARAAAAADAAVLAAADALAGYADGSPCGLAQTVATASGAGLADCQIDGLEARVTATVPVGPLTASVTARAGPPPWRSTQMRPSAASERGACGCERAMTPCVQCRIVARSGRHPLSIEQ